MCPEKSVISAELTLEPGLTTLNLEHGSPKPTSSTRTIHGFKVRNMLVLLTKLLILTSSSGFW
jgi:hypothetical protein